MCRYISKVWGGIIKLGYVNVG